MAELTFEKVLQIKRISKVTKGGKNLSFSALVVVGDQNGHVGYAMEKANEVVDAIRKSLNKAKKDLIYIERYGTTITHDIVGEFGASKVVLKPASEGTGIIAGEVVRAVCEAAGIRDILSKSLKSNTPINLLRATLNGLTQLKPRKTSVLDASEQENAVVASTTVTEEVNKE